MTPPRPPHTRVAPIEAMQLQRFNGETWELFGDIIHAESS